jgi:hypothetical protein
MSYSAVYDVTLGILIYIFTIARRDVTRWGSFAYPSSDAYELGLTLSGVCRHFRCTVRGMPEFWDKISVSGHGHDQAFRRLLTIIKKHSPGVVKEIESAGIRIQPRASLASYDEEGQVYWESWGGPKRRPSPW